MTILPIGKNSFNSLGLMLSLLNTKIENNFKARSYNAAVLELSKLPESVLKGIGMNHSNVRYKTYELIYGKK